MEHLIFSHMYDTLVITIVNSYCKPKSPTKPLSQIASFTASLASIYFGLVVNKATIECKVTFQLIVLPQSSYIPYQRHYSIQISSIVIINITNNCPRDITTFIITKPTCDIPLSINVSISLFSMNLSKAIHISTHNTNNMWNVLLSANHNTYDAPKYISIRNM